MRSEYNDKMFLLFLLIPHALKRKINIIKKKENSLKSITTMYNWQWVGMLNMCQYVWIGVVFFLSNHAMTSFFFLFGFNDFQGNKREKDDIYRISLMENRSIYVKNCKFFLLCRFFWCFDLIFMNTLNIFQTDRIQDFSTFILSRRGKTFCFVCNWPT